MIWRCASGVEHAFSEPTRCQPCESARLCLLQAAPLPPALPPAPRGSAPLLDFELRLCCQRRRLRLRRRLSFIIGNLRIQVRGSTCRIPHMLYLARREVRCFQGGHRIARCPSLHGKSGMAGK